MIENDDLTNELSTINQDNNNKKIVNWCADAISWLILQSINASVCDRKGKQHLLYITLLVPDIFPRCWILNEFAIAAMDCFIFTDSVHFV